MSSAKAQFEYHARQIIATLRHAGPEALPSGIYTNLDGLADAAQKLGIPVPIKAWEEDYPDGSKGGPFDNLPMKGYLTIHYANGAVSGPSWAAHAFGWQLLVQARKSAMMALQQWLAHLDSIPSKCVRHDQRGPGKPLKYTDKKSQRVIELYTKGRKPQDIADTLDEPIRWVRRVTKAHRERLANRG